MADDNRSDDVETQMVSAIEASAASMFDDTVRRITRVRGYVMVADIEGVNGDGQPFRDTLVQHGDGNTLADALGMLSYADLLMRTSFSAYKNGE